MTPRLLSDNRHEEEARETKISSFIEAARSAELTAEDLADPTFDWQNLTDLANALNRKNHPQRPRHRYPSDATKSATIEYFRAFERAQEERTAKNERKVELLFQDDPFTERRGRTP